MNAIELAKSTFVIKSVTLRHHLDEKGQPWFLAKDICDYLEISNVSDACGRIFEDCKGIVKSDTPGGRQDVLTVNEPGLYQLIFQSRKPEAVNFQRWVFAELLPTLRRQGYYKLPGRELPVGDQTGKGKHGRQPLLDVIKARGITMAAFVTAINQLDLDVPAISDGSFGNQVYGGCRVSRALAIRATTFLNLPAEELFTETSRSNL